MSVTHTFVSALPDDPADAAAGLVVSSNWNDSHAIDSIEITGGTVTASTPLIDATQTWNNGAVTFAGWNLAITDTASGSLSYLLHCSVGGVQRFFVRKEGSIYTTGDIIMSGGGINGGSFLAMSPVYGFALRNSFQIQWSSDGNYYGTPDIGLWRDAAGVLAQRNGTTAQTHRVYGTYTDSSNYVRASLASSSTAITLAAETAGTGADNVPVNITPAGTEGVVIGNFAQFTEMTAPAAGASNTSRLFCEDNGSGKTRLMVQFASGAAVQIAIEP